jgi:Ca2+-binding EF-hand superfamily protein
LFCYRDELRQVFEQLGQDMSESELDAMIKSNDKEGDGCLTFDEFVNSVYPTVTEVKDSDED